MNPAGGMRLGYIGLLQWVKCWQFVHNLCCQWPRMVESLRGGCSHLVPCFSRQNGGIDLERKSWRSTVYRQFPPELCRNVNPAPKLLLGDYKEFEDGLVGFERIEILSWFILEHLWLSACRRVWPKATPPTNKPIPKPRIHCGSGHPTDSPPAP